MAEKTQFANSMVPIPQPEIVCCYNCRHAKHDPTIPLGAVASRQQFVKCIWGPPSVVVIPMGIDQTTGQTQVMIQSKFPVMGYIEFCHRFESN